MLTIQNEQFETLTEEAREDFMRRLVQHVDRYFPRVTARLGAPQTRAAVQAAWEMSLRHGFETEYGVCQFTNLVFTFGGEVEQEPWAADILRQGNYPTEAARADRLNRAAAEVLEKLR